MVDLAVANMTLPPPGHRHRKLPSNLEPCQNDPNADLGQSLASGQSRRRGFTERDADFDMNEILFVREDQKWTRRFKRKAGSVIESRPVETTLIVLVVIYCV